MMVKLIPLGCSWGVELPNDFVERFRVGEAIEMRMVRDAIVLGPSRGPREGWDEAFAKAAAETGRARSGSDASDWDNLEREW